MVNYIFCSAKQTFSGGWKGKWRANLIHHFISVFFLYFSITLPARKDQSPFPILIFGLEDFIDPGLLKICPTLTGLSLWICIQKCFWKVPMAIPRLFFFTLPNFHFSPFPTRFHLNCIRTNYTRWHQMTYYKPISLSRYKIYVGVDVYLIPRKDSWYISFRLYTTFNNNSGAPVRRSHQEQSRRKRGKNIQVTWQNCHFNWTHCLTSTPGANKPSLLLLLFFKLLILSRGLYVASVCLVLFRIIFWVVCYRRVLLKKSGGKDWQ